MDSFVAVLFGLLVGHAVGDVSLQSAILSQSKRKQFSQAHWFYFLFAHALIHGGAVYVVTGNHYLGMAETACHFVIDYFKCEDKISLAVDQALHFACKVAWALVCVL